LGGEREGVEWVVREGVGAGGEMTQALYAHMNNKRKKSQSPGCDLIQLFCKNVNSVKTENRDPGVLV
jgi:hypothetical protein